MKKALICLALVGLCASLAFAEKGTPVQATAGQKVVPLTYQAIGSDMKPFGPVYPYTAGGIAQTEVLAFDCFSPDSTGFPSDDLYGTGCGSGSNRWYLGTTYDNPHHAYDIHLTPGTEGALATRMEFAWYDSRPTNTGESFYVVTFPIEDYEASCVGNPPFTTSYNGVIFSFGVLAPGSGYYYTDITGLTIPFQLPIDGVGGVVTIYAQNVTASSITLSSAYHQPMLWGTFDSACIPAGTNPNFQVHTQWDDDNPLDGSFNPAVPPNGECYSYYYGVCPDPLGAMVCYYAVAGGPDTLRCDSNCDTYFDGFDIDPFFLLLQSVDDWHAAGYTCDEILAGDANCDNYVDGFDIDPFFVGLEVGECICP